MITRIKLFRFPIYAAFVFYILCAGNKIANAQTEDAESTDKAVPAGLPPSSRSLGAGRPRLDSMRNAALSANLSIDFYGKTVDENAQPLAGVDVQIRFAQYVIQPTGHPIDAHLVTNLFTDSNGLFRFHGENGISFTVENLAKDGFYPAKYEVPRTFSVPAAGPSKTIPAQTPIFIMYSNQVKDQLLTKDLIFKIAANQEIYAVDLITGKLSHGGNTRGDLNIWLKRPAGANFGQPYSWSYGLSVPEGGLLETGEESFDNMILAPSDGYVPSYNYSDKASTNSIDTEECFYLKSRLGKIFARVKIGVDPFFSRVDTNASVRIRYTVNPTGARILR